MVISIYCAYHPGKNAVSICQKCRKSICELDVNKAGEPKLSSEEYNFCFFCYKERIHPWVVLLIGLSIAFFFSFSFLLSYLRPANPQSYSGQSGTNSSGSIISLIFGISFLMLCIVLYFNSNSKIKEATKRYASAATNKSGSESTIQNTSPSLHDSNICTFCRNKLFSDDEFCSNCGYRRT